MKIYNDKYRNLLTTETLFKNDNLEKAYYF
jgi:hypothetical protein